MSRPDRLAAPTSRFLQFSLPEETILTGLTLTTHINHTLESFNLILTHTLDNFPRMFQRKVEML